MQQIVCCNIRGVFHNKCVVRTKVCRQGVPVPQFAFVTCSLHRVEGCCQSHAWQIQVLSLIQSKAKLYDQSLQLGLAVVAVLESLSKGAHAFVTAAITTLCISSLPTNGCMTDSVNVK